MLAGGSGGYRPPAAKEKNEKRKKKRIMVGYLLLVREMNRGKGGRGGATAHPAGTKTKSRRQEDRGRV